MGEPSELLKQVLATSDWSFDPLRDPKWIPDRGDYRALADALREQSARLAAVEWEKECAEDGAGALAADNAALAAARQKCRKNVREAEASGDSDRIHTAYKLSSFLADALPDAWVAVEEKVPDALPKEAE